MNRKVETTAERVCTYCGKSLPSGKEAKAHPVLIEHGKEFCSEECSDRWEAEGVWKVSEKQ